jgi:hypothetical protein
MSRVPRPPPPSPPEDLEEEDDVVEDLDETEEMDEMDMIDPMEALGSFLATEDGETVATALVGLKDATEKISMNLELQNKILVKILSALGKTGCRSCECAQAPATA